MPVFDNFEQYGPFPGVKRHKEQVIKDKQPAPLDLLEFCLECTLDFGHFQCPEQFWGIGIESAESPYARLVAEGTGQKAFSRTGRACDEKVLPFVHEIQGGEAFHLIALKAPVRGIVNLSETGLVSERRIPGKLHYGSLGTVIPFTCKEHGQEGSRGHGLWSGAGKRMCQNEPNPESQIKDFRGFSSFRELGNAANGIFYSSQYWESRFSPIFCFPNVGKVDFR